MCPSSAPGADYDRVARLYDLTYADFVDDLPMYQGFAERCGPPLLEVGCGTGRLILPLAQAGFSITGIDLSSAMLAIAQRKVEQAGVADRVSLRRADARHLDLAESFGLAIIASNSFGLFTERADQLQVLDSVRRHLRPGGILVIDMFNPDLALLSAESGQLYHDFTRVDPDTGRTVIKLDSRRVDLARQIIDVTFIYDEMGRDGTVRRTLFPFPTRFFFLGEMELLLDKGGFEVEAVYGSYDYMEEYGSDSDRIIVVATPTSLRRPGRRRAGSR